MKVRVHKFTVNDCEDPDLFAAAPLYEWQQSDAGKWILEHALDKPIWHRVIDAHTYSFNYAITAELDPKDYTYWSLKYG